MENKEKTTQISISLPTVLVESIDKMAVADSRNRSNFIATTLTRLAKEAIEKGEIK